MTVASLCEVAMPLDQAEAEPPCLGHVGAYFGILMVPFWMPAAMPVSSWA